MNKYYLHIVGAILLFIGCAAGGFFLSDVINLDSESEDAVTVGPGADTGTGPAADEGAGVSTGSGKITDVVTVTDGGEIKGEDTDTTTNAGTGEDVNIVTGNDGNTNIVAVTDEGTNTGTDDVTTPEPPVVSATPVIKSVWFPPFKDWHSGKPERIGYKVVVTASTESNDKLKYEMMSNDGKWKYSSASGTFPEVYPTEDGLYTLVVTNTRTQEQVTQDVRGLVKRNKLSAASIEQQLRNGSLDKKFYFYFVPKVKFRCLGSGIPADSTPATLNALVGVAGMYDIDVKDESLQYDEWNRITSFDIELN